MPPDRTAFLKRLSPFSLSAAQAMPLGDADVVGFAYLHHEADRASEGRVAIEAIDRRVLSSKRGTEVHPLPDATPLTNPADSRRVRGRVGALEAASGEGTCSYHPSEVTASVRPTIKGHVVRVDRLCARDR